jgi:hypothetical protein
MWRLAVLLLGIGCIVYGLALPVEPLEHDEACAAAPCPVSE